MKKLFFFLLFFLFVSAAAAQQEGKISLDIKGMDVVDVLKMLAARSGINIVIGKNVAGKVTLFLKDVDVWDAFEITLLASDLAYDKEGDIINVMSQRDYEQIYGERYKDRKAIKIIQLKNAKAADLARSLIQIKTNVGKVVADEASNTLVLIDSQEKIGEMAEFIKNADLAIQTRVFSLNYAQAEKLSAKIQDAATKGAGSIKIDERTNKMAVTDYPERLDEIAKMITAFDEKTQQVLIDAQIVEINPQKDQFTMGVDWDFWFEKNARLIASMPAPSVADIATIPNKLSIGTAAGGTNVTEQGQYKSIVDLLRVIGETKILSSPRIMALNNEEAKILVGTKEAYITSSISQTGTGTAVTSQSVNFVDVGIKLYVTPTINRDGFVTMKIKPEISSSKRTDITSDGKVTQIPIVTTSESETTVMVKDGTTIIIAGLKRDRREKEVKKIPVLGDIPLLGLAFRSTRDEVTKTELVIFITPRIISGAVPLEYKSLTKDKDIIRIQAEAISAGQAVAGSGSALLPKDEAFDYKRQIFEKIRATSISVYLESSERSLEGEAELFFTLRANGRLKGRPVVVRANDERLKKISIRAVEEAASFPRFPEGTYGKEEKFHIILEYR